jgi:hypothetical protein
VDEIKPKQQYTAEDLQHIYGQMRPGALLIPMNHENGPAPDVGPRFMVYRLHSELGLDPSDPEVAYWDALKQADVIDGIGEISWINGNLSEARATDAQIHQDLAGRFVESGILNRIAINQLPGGASSVVFNRIGCLLTIRHLMLFGGTELQLWNPYKIGRLALLANDFVQNTKVPATPAFVSVELLLLMAPAWDIYNSGHLGHAMSRMFTLFTEILPGSDPVVMKLVSKLGIDPNKTEIDGIPLYQFAAIVFGLFAYARSPQAQVRVLFNPQEIFTPTGLSQELFDRFLKARARTLEEFRTELNKDGVISQATFSEELKRRSFLIESLNVFRKYPLFRLGVCLSKGRVCAGKGLEYRG